MCKLSGLSPVAVIGELVNDDDQGTMMRLNDCQEFGKKHGIPLISIEELAQYLKK